MKYSWRVFVAAQFAVLAFFMSKVIPYSGYILLPTVWIIDRRMFWWYLVFDFITSTPTFFGLSETIKNPLAVAAIIGSAVFAFTWNTFFVSIIIKRKLKKRAPDVWGMIAK